MTRYLLDTNAVSNLADDPDGPIARRIAKVGVDKVVTGVVVNGEIKFALQLKQGKRLRALTTNVGEFSRVPGLKKENWLQV